MANNQFLIFSRISSSKKTFDEQFRTIVTVQGCILTSAGCLSHQWELNENFLEQEGKALSQQNIEEDLANHSSLNF